MFQAKKRPIKRLRMQNGAKIT